MYDLSTFIITKFGSDFTRSGNEMLYHCPFCPSFGKRNNDRKLYVNSKNGKYNCFRCGSSGHILGSNNQRLIKLLSDDNSDSAISELLNFLNIKEPESDLQYYPIPTSRVVDYPNTVPFNYLVERGISPKLMDFYDIRGFGSEWIFHNRVVIPNKIVHKNWTDFYTCRAILPDMKPRYLNLNLAKKSHIIFNIDRIQNGQNLIINEGCINSIIAGVDSIAILGKVASQSQISQIVMKNPPIIWISLDYDARSWALKLAADLHHRLPNSEIRLVDLPDGEDAASLGRSNYLELLSESKPLYYACSKNSLSKLFEDFLH